MTSHSRCGEQAGQLLGLEPAAAGLVAEARVALELAGQRHLAQLLEAVGAVLLAEVGEHERAGHLGDGGVLLLRAAVACGCLVRVRLLAVGRRLVRVRLLAVAHAAEYRRMARPRAAVPAPEAGHG